MRAWFDIKITKLRSWELFKVRLSVKTTSLKWQFGFRFIRNELLSYHLRNKKVITWNVNQHNIQSDKWNDLTITGLWELNVLPHGMHWSNWTRSKISMMRSNYYYISIVVFCGVCMCVCVVFSHREQILYSMNHRTNI